MDQPSISQKPITYLGSEYHIVPMPKKMKTNLTSNPDEPI